MKQPLTDKLAGELFLEGLSPSRAAERMKLHKRRVSFLCNDGRLGYWVKGRYLIHPREIDQFQKNKRGSYLGLNDEYSLAEVGKHIGCSIEKVKQKVRDRVIGYEDQDGIFRVNQRDILRYLSGHRKSYHDRKVSTKEACCQLGISQAELKKLAKKGDIGSVKNKKVVVTQRQVEDWLASQDKQEKTKK